MPKSGGNGYTDAEEWARPKEWRPRIFAIPHKCYFCNTSVWGLGYVAYVNWTFDADVYRAHTECLTMGVLGGNN